MSSNEQTLKEFDLLAKQYAAAHDLLSDRAGALDVEITNVYRRRLAGIRAALATALDAKAALSHHVERYPHLFVTPRSMTLHGVKFGYRKGTGSIEWDDDAHVVKLIKKHLPEQADVLVATVEKPISDALNQLDVSTLRKIGCTAEEAGDLIFVKTTDSELNKLLKRLLKEGSQREPAKGKEAA